MEEVRLGTIGSGKIVHQILDNVLRTEGIRLQSAYSRSKEKAEQLVKEYGGCSAYTDLSAMLADEAVNTVYIASPNLLHYEQAKAALLAGKNVICEKPFVTRAEQARELSALARFGCHLEGFALKLLFVALCLGFCGSYFEIL